jgi:hypothetical protein
MVSTIRDTVHLREEYSSSSVVVYLQMVIVGWPNQEVRGHLQVWGF